MKTLDVELGPKFLDFEEESYSQIDQIESASEVTLTRSLAPIYLKDAPGCSSAIANGLSQQLIYQINLISPDTLVSFDDLPVELEKAAFPYMQPEAKEALRKAISERGQSLRINSAYRPISQQLFLYNRREGRLGCGYNVVAKPGGSQHQSGLALDTPDWSVWRPYLEKQGWKWYGTGDAVHFDYTGPGTKDIRPIAVKAFQILWNKNHPEDKIAEDGSWGDETESRLNRSPVKGFAIAPWEGNPRILKRSRPSMQGLDVEKLQQALIKYGEDIDADGDFGPGTEAALKRVQGKMGLKVDGIAGPEVLAKIAGQPMGISSASAEIKTVEPDVAKKSTYQLRILVDTILKMRPLQSAILPDEEECSISAGTMLKLHSYVPVEDHIKVAFADQAFNGRNTWYIYSGHVQILKDDKAVEMSGKQIKITKDTVLKLKPIQSSQLAPEERKSVHAGETFDILSYALEGDHIRVTSFGQFDGSNTWYAYFPDVEVLEDDEPLPLGSKQLTEEDYKEAANFLNVDIPTIKAVVRVESCGRGFLKDGRPKILFEAHCFGKDTGYCFDRTHPNISGRKWDTSKYFGGSREYKRLEEAKALNEEAALKSASWGLGQVMGFNYRAAGYSDVYSFVKDMHVSEGKQLMAMMNFIKNNGLDKALREHDWAAFARGYNGPRYQENQYDRKLAEAYRCFGARV